MRIDWYRVKFVKGVLPYFHKTMVFLFFVAGYARLRLKRHYLKKEKADRRLVVINLFEHFGDIVACEPVARFIRNEYPDGYIIWNVKRVYGELLRHNPHIDEIFYIRCMTEWIFLAKSGIYDVMVDLHPQMRGCHICRKALLKDSGNAEITVDNYYNYGNLLAAYCQCAGITEIEEGPKVYIPRETVKSIDLLWLPERFVVVHCSSNEESRAWERDKWRQLAGRIINDLELPVVEIGLRPVLDFASSLQVNLCGRLSLLETAEVIRRASLFIGIDSGPAHLANAVGTYGIILLGEYRVFRRYMPYSGGYKTGENARIIYSAGPSVVISVDEVYDAVRAYKSRHKQRVA